MNCRQAERWVLLMRSGELPLRKQTRLERHVSACPRCRAYREDVDRILAAVEQGLQSEEPGAGALVAIRNAARDRVSTRQGSGERMGSLVFVRWRPLLACAAGVLICVAGWYMLAGRQSPSPVIKVSEQALPAFEDELAPPSGSLYELTIVAVEEDVHFERISDLADRPDVSLVERELMILEGLAI
ncbi:hypothetical protein ACFLQR_05065 [Verrucomicrobiota bacterium]